MEGVGGRARRAEAAKRAFERRRAWLSAVSQQEMVRGAAAAARRREAAKKGLVILRAAYGEEAAIGPLARGEGGEEAAGSSERALDVTAALQFLVRDSKLRLYAGSKRDYVGFCAMGEDAAKAKLYVRYAFNGFVYELEVEDAEPVYLPAFRATLLGKEEEVE